jgi:hypothetical protein
MRSHPPPPTPPHRCAEGGGKNQQPTMNWKAPPNSPLHEHSHAPRVRSSPLPPRAQRVVGRGRGWGVFRQIRCRLRKENMRSHPPPPTPPRRCAEGGGKSALGMWKQKAPPGSTEIPPASCRRRSARSARSNGRRAPFRAAPADARAATSRGQRTISGNARATTRPARPGMRGKYAARLNR